VIKVGVGPKVGVCVGVPVGVGVFGASRIPAETLRVLKENNSNIVNNKLIITVAGFALLLINYLLCKLLFGDLIISPPQ